MSPQMSQAAPPKPTLPPFWKWLTRITAIIALTLFLTPTVYVMKYYFIDKPAEEAYIVILRRDSLVPLPIVDVLPYWEEVARDTSSDERIQAINHIGRLLQYPGINYKRPIECLAAKATLADLAVHDKNLAVRTAASEELGKVAQTGAILRR